MISDTRFLYLVLSTQEDYQGLYLGSLDDPHMKLRLVPTDVNGAFGAGSDGGSTCSASQRTTDR